MARKLYTVLSLRTARQHCRPGALMELLVSLTQGPVPLTVYYETRNWLLSGCEGGAETLD